MKILKTFFVSTITLCILCSCSLGMFKTKSDKEIADEKLTEILSILQKKSCDELKNVFSKQSLDSTMNFDESANELFEYFVGEVKSFDGGFPYVDTSNENGEFFQAFEATYGVITSTGKYRIAFRFVTEDTVNPQNIGVQSFYIIKAEDEVNQEYAYWGDGKFTPGIHIGVPNWSY